MFIPQIPAKCTGQIPQHLKDSLTCTPQSNQISHLGSCEAALCLQVSLGAGKQSKAIVLPLPV